MIGARDNGKWVARKALRREHRGQWQAIKETINADIETSTIQWDNELYPNRFLAALRALELNERPLKPKGDLLVSYANILGYLYVDLYGEQPDTIVCTRHELHQMAVERDAAHSLSCVTMDRGGTPRVWGMKVIYQDEPGQVYLEGPKARLEKGA